MKNRDKDGGLKWIFKTYFKIFLKQSKVRMRELCSLHIFKMQTPQYGETYPQKVPEKYVDLPFVFKRVAKM